MVKIKQKINMIFITHFFEPEIGAASQRITSLVKRALTDNNKIFVITTIPLYKIEDKINFFEDDDNLTIIRFPVFQSNSKNILLRLISMINFSFYLFLLIPVFLFLNHRKVFIQGHPLVTSFFSIFIFKKLFRKKIILNVSDLWPKSGLELGVFKKGLFYSLLKKIEKFNYNNSDLIMAQSNESKNYISEIVPNKNIVVFYNVPKSDFKTKVDTSNKKLTIIYAGLLGHAQNILQSCIKINFKNLDAVLHIYGEGTQKKEITDYIKKNNINNIIVHDFIPRNQLNKKLISADVGLVQLKHSIHGALPSKLFHYLNYSLPIIYIGSGEAAKIVNENKFGWSFKNDDYNGINSLIEKIITNRKILYLAIDSINNNFKAKYNYETQYASFKNNSNF